MSENMESKIKEIVAKHLGVDEEKITPTAKFVDDLGADSLDQVELVMAFEEEFSCEIPDEVAEKIVTLADAVNFVQANSDEAA